MSDFTNINDANLIAIANIPTKGVDPTGAIVTTPIGNTVAKTNSTLTPNGTWTTGWLLTDKFIGAETVVFSDVAGTYTIEFSDDNGSTQSMPAINVPYTQTSQTRRGVFGISASYLRFSYINGSTTQGSFKFEIKFLTQEAQSSMETLNAKGADTRTASWTKSIIETKDSPTGSYDYIYRTGNSLNVNLTGGSNINATIDQGVAGTGIAQPTGGSGVLGMLSAIKQFLANPLAVTGTFFQATQPVSAVSLPLPSGAATSANQTTMATKQDTGNVSLASIDGKLPSLGQRVAAGSIPVVLASDQGAIPIKPQGSTSVTTTRVSSTAATTNLLALNANRKGFSFTPESTLFVKFGSGATATNYDVKMLAGMLYESRPDVVYTGLITCYGLASVQASEYA